MEKIKIGIIGAGMRTVFLMQELLKREELEVAALADINQDSLDMVTECYGGSWEQYLDYKQLLNRKDIEGVIIVSPDFEHEEQAIAAFEAGKHVFLEKPIATTLEGAERVMGKMKQTGKILLVGFVLRYHKQYQKLKEVVEGGVIGELKTGWVLHSVGAGSNWYFHDWHGEMKNTGGLLLQKGSHDFDIINWIVAAKVNKIAAFGSRDFFGGDKPNDLTCQSCSENKICSEAVMDWYYSWNTPKGAEAKILYNRWRNKCAFRTEIDVPDNHQVLLEYENGVKITYLECHYTPEDNREYTFIGTKGKVKLDSASNTVTVQLRKDMYDRSAKVVYSETQAQNADDIGNYGIVDDFVKALTSGEQPKAGGVDGLYAVQAGILAHESMKAGKIVSTKKFADF